MTDKFSLRIDGTNEGTALRLPCVDKDDRAFPDLECEPKDHMWYTLYGYVKRKGNNASTTRATDVLKPPACERDRYIL